jgi:hypothetical protein
MSRRKRLYGGCRGLDRARVPELDHLGDVEVRDADVADLALVDKFLKRIGGRGKREIGIRPVDLEQINVVGAERAQALLHSLAQPLAARVAHHAVVGHAQSALGCDHDLVAAVLELIAQDPPTQAPSRA